MGLRKLSCLWRCPQFRGVLIEGGSTVYSMYATCRHRPDVCGVGHATQRLPARYRESSVLGVGDQHQRPPVEVSVSEREEIVVVGHQTIPATPNETNNHCVIPNSEVSSFQRLLQYMYSGTPLSRTPLRQVKVPPPELFKGYIAERGGVVEGVLN